MRDSWCRWDGCCRNCSIYISIFPTEWLKHRCAYICAAKNTSCCILIVLSFTIFASPGQIFLVFSQNDLYSILHIMLKSILLRTYAEVSFSVAVPKASFWRRTVLFYCSSPHGRNWSDSGGEPAPPPLQQRCCWSSSERIDVS